MEEREKEGEKAESGTGRRELERRELDLLTGEGFRFEIPVGKGKKTFTVHEPTAWVLDCMSALCLEMEMDENLLANSEGFLNESRRLVRKNAFLLSRVIGVAVAGDTYSPFPPVRWARGLFHRVKVRRLSRLFYHSLAPSKMKEISSFVLAASNLGDFINSIRLLSGARTTISGRIEKQD
ncbi:MAG: hypothetical protein LBJ01_12055 [Tannerella sp.]|jgi:hypothetical protein|nr:hypothetical protein [Tannerella sp.]